MAATVMPRYLFNRRFIPLRNLVKPSWLIKVPDHKGILEAQKAQCPFVEAGLVPRPHPLLERGFAKKPLPRTQSHAQLFVAA